jgi:hypothetical protein
MPSVRQVAQHALSPKEHVFDALHRAFAESSNLSKHVSTLYLSIVATKLTQDKAAHAHRR